MIVKASLTSAQWDGFAAGKSADVIKMETRHHDRPMGGGPPIAPNVNHPVQPVIDAPRLLPQDPVTAVHAGFGAPNCVKLPGMRFFYDSLIPPSR